MAETIQSAEHQNLDEELTGHYAPGFHRYANKLKTKGKAREADIFREGADQLAQLEAERDALEKELRAQGLL